MDKQRKKSTFGKYRKHYLFVLVISAAVLIYLFLSRPYADGRVQQVNVNSFMVNDIIQGKFEDTLKLRARVSPQTSIYLDAIAGGRVEEKLVEYGQYVEQGQPLLRLSNVSLQLDVMSREAQVTEQLNFLRNTQMTMTTNRLNLRRDILEIDLKIAHLTRKIKQSQLLVDKGGLARDKLKTYQLDIQYYRQRKTLTEQRQKQEEQIRKVQVLQLEESAAMLQKNLTFARNNLDNLLVKAPVSGYLSDLNVELGESKSQGARLGQIDIPNHFKMVANIDEYYLNQVTVGMPAAVFVNKQKVELTVSKVDSRVAQSQFQIELNLPVDIANIKRGQNLDIELTLSDGTENSLLVKRGAFVNSTGGNWLFVLDASGQSASKRLIKLGKKNANYYQVISGLKAGERVITSNYSAFDKADIVRITGVKS